MSEHDRHEPAPTAPPGEPASDDADIADFELSDDDLQDDGVLGDQLRELLHPTDGLDRRTARDVDSALRARSPLNAAFELFGVGWWTVETLFTDRSLTDDPRRADGDGEGT